MNHRETMPLRARQSCCCSADSIFSLSLPAPRRQDATCPGQQTNTVASVLTNSYQSNVLRSNQRTQQHDIIAEATVSSQHRNFSTHLMSIHTMNQPSTFNKPKVFLIVLSLTVLFVALMYQPLPEDFPQPWKYRFLSYSAFVISKLVRDRAASLCQPY